MSPQHVAVVRFEVAMHTDAGEQTSLINLKGWLSSL